MGIGREGNVKWVDGLRGIASTLVVLTHIARAFHGELFVPATSEGAYPVFLQWPLIRILFQGRIGVSIFSLVTGFVCALKPLKLCRQGNQEAAMTGMGRSALRRVPRLVIPAGLATVLIWLYCQLGAFDIAHRADSWWVHSTSPVRHPDGFVASAKDMMYNLITTWTRSQNVYDGNQWTLLPLLRGSMTVYVFVAATAYVQPRYRMMASLGMWLYMYISSDSAFGMQFFWGVFLSDLQQHPPALAFLSERPRTCRFLAAILLSTGLLLASYPEQKEEWVAWSRVLKAMLQRVLPRDPDYPRFASGLGLEMISLGLHFSPYLRDLLANRHLLWLGKQSFAVYLLHGPLLRSVLTWMVYGVSMPPDEKNDKGETVPGTLRYPGGAWLLACCVLWLPLNYAAANVWTAHVDPWCGRVTERLVARITGTGEGGGTSGGGNNGAVKNNTGTAPGADDRVAEKEARIAMSHSGTLLPK